MHLFSSANINIANDTLSNILKAFNKSLTV